jgi:peptide/nickel transport system substrate-binding protein
MAARGGSDFPREDTAMRRATIGLLTALAAASPGAAEAQNQGQPVPEIKILTWPAARYQSYYETSNYVAEGWRKLGLKVTLDPQPFPNPMLAMWFTRHEFDVVMSVLSGQPQRMAPGDFNVGSFSHPKVDELGARQLEIYDREERRKIVNELQRVLVEEQPEAIVATTNYIFAINTANADIPGYEESPDGPRAPWNMIKMAPKNGTVVRIGRTIDQTTFNPLAATTVVVKIRQGHTFSDGKPVTAEDVKFSYDYFKKWEAVFFKKYLERVASVEVVDPQTVRFKLSQPFAPFIMNTLGQVLVLPKHVWENIVEQTGIKRPQEYRNVPLVGSGAYTLRHFREGQELYLARRDGHFMKPASDLLIIVFGSAEVVGAALKKGDIDVSFQPILPTVAKEFGAEKNIRLLHARGVGYMSMRYNMQRPVMQNRDLRRAMAHAIPYEQIIADVLGGDGDRSATPIVPANPYWHNAALPLPKYDIEKARAMLKDAGFTWGPDGALRYPAK